MLLVRVWEVWNLCLNPRLQIWLANVRTWWTSSLLNSSQSHSSKFSSSTSQKSKGISNWFKLNEDLISSFTITFANFFFFCNFTVISFSKAFRLELLFLSFVKWNSKFIFRSSILFLKFGDTSTSFRNYQNFFQLNLSRTSISLNIFRMTFRLLYVIGRADLNPWFIHTTHLPTLYLRYSNSVIKSYTVHELIISENFPGSKHWLMLRFHRDATFASTWISSEGLHSRAWIFNEHKI